MTNKFKFKFKITGLQLEVEGTREDVAAITSNFGNQLRGLAQPQGLGQKSPDYHDVEAEVVNEDKKQLEAPKRKKARRTASASIEAGKDAGVALEIRIDSKKYGTPVSSWVTSKKAMWILYVCKKEGLAVELTTNEITLTFNKHFKQAKIIQHFNVSRDLGKAKVGTKSFVGEDTNKNPSSWYLTDEGIKHVEKIIAEQLSENGAS